MPKYKTTPEAYQLLHEGAIALAEVEAVGVRVDKTYLETTTASMGKRIAKAEARMRSDKVYKVWRKTFGDRTNIGSHDQLGQVIFGRLGIPCPATTPTGKYKTDKEVLEKVDLPIVRDYLKVESIKYDRSHYVDPILKELVYRDGMYFYHPSFMLNTARSMRSSSGSDKTNEERRSKEINWQNLPARDPDRAKLVRTAFIPRPGRLFVENDLAQIEVRVPAAVTGDEALERYVKDKSTDMHRDSGRDVWIINEPDGSAYWKDKLGGKAVRQATKTNFVFASFYEAAFFTCAAKMWDDMDRFRLTAPGGVPMKKHLARHGITECGVVLTKNDEGHMKLSEEPRRGTFCHHLKGVQGLLWQRFHGYAEWKQRIWEQYLRDGCVVMATGFCLFGMRIKREITNYLIQGPGFHIELKTVIEVLRRLKKYKMKSKIIGEIHDSNQGDVIPKEIEAYLDIQHDVVTRYIPKVWPWLRDIPLEVESEVSPTGLSWYEKEQWVKHEGEWGVKT